MNSKGMSSSLANHAGLFGIGLGLFGLYLLWVLLWACTGVRDIRSMTLGADHRTSTSKLQFWLWTAVILFSYIAIYATKAALGDASALTSFDQSLFWVMGMSSATAIGAKIVTVGQIASGAIAKISPTQETPPPSVTTGGSNLQVQPNSFPLSSPASDPDAPQTSSPTPAIKPDYSLGPAILDDQNNVDLGKIQMLAWTLVGIGVYLTSVITLIHSHALSALQLPGIGTPLLTLMGVGSAAYVGSKASSPTVVRINGITPSSAKPTDVITLSGQGFGLPMPGNQVTLDGQPIHNGLGITSWSPTQIQFIVPDTPPTTKSWSVDGQKAEVGVGVQGVNSSNSVSLVVTGPVS